VDRSKTAKALSAGVIANLALAGFVAAPAGASITHSTAIPGAARAHTSLVAAPARTSLTAKYPQADAAQAAKSISAEQRGFVPRTGTSQHLTSTCSGHTCIGVTHSGSTASSVGEHFFNWPGVHVAHITFIFNDGFHQYFSDRYFGSHQSYVLSHFQFSHVQSVCGYFNTVPPASPGVCVHI
jgi:hypothetical protein